MTKGLLLGALVLQAGAATAAANAATPLPITTMICKLSTFDQEAWQDCGAVLLSNKTANDGYSHGPRGKCSDLTFLMGHFGDGNPDRDDFLIVARSTKIAENTEATTVAFPVRYPERFRVQPSFAKRASVSVDCTVKTEAP